MKKTKCMNTIFAVMIVILMITASSAIIQAGNIQHDEKIITEMPSDSIFSLEFKTKSELRLDTEISLILEAESEYDVNNAVIDIRLPSNMVLTQGNIQWNGKTLKGSTIRIPLKVKISEQKDYAIYATISDKDGIFEKFSTAYYFTAKDNKIDASNKPISFYSYIDETTGERLLPSETISINKEDPVGDGKGESLGYSFEGRWIFFDEFSNTEVGVKYAKVDLISMDSPSYVSVIESYDTPTNNPIGLTWISVNDFFYGETGVTMTFCDDSLYSLWPYSDGFYESSFELPCNDPSDLTWEDDYLWISDSSSALIYKIYGEDVVQIIGSPTQYPIISDPTGITWDGTYLWIADSDACEIYQIDPVNSDENFVDLVKVIEGPNNENYLYGLTWDGEHLWVTDGRDTIYEIDPDLSNANHCEVVNSYDAPGSGSWGPNGLAWDGQNLWLSDEFEDKIYKLYVGPEPVATTYTDSYGYYEFDDVQSGQYYKAKIFSETSEDSSHNAVRVQNNFEHRYTSSTDWIYLNTNKYVESEIQGNFKSSFNILNNLVDIYDWLNDEVSWSRDKINVWWPAPGTYFSPAPDFDYIGVGPGYEWDRMAHHHEYGHAIMFTAYDDTMPPTGNYCGHWLSMETDPGFAIVEGWAEFIQGVVDNNGGAPSGYGCEWITETIDDQTGDIWENSISVFDEYGASHIVYHWSSDTGDECLKYAYQLYSGSPWEEIEIIDDNINSGHSCDIVVDEDEIPHVCYQGGSQGSSLYYARRSGSGGSWETGEVWPNSVSSETSMDIDSLGNPHIAFYDAYYDSLKYAYYDGDQWNFETVDMDSSGNGVGQYASIKIDSDDNPHISYYDTVNNDLKYATKSGSSWDIDIVDAYSCGQYSSIDIDENNNPHISYRDSSVVKYATKSGSTWYKETVDDSYNQPVIFPTSITVESSDVVHICYYHNPGSILRYATKVSGSWDIVDVAEGVDQFCAIDLWTFISVYDEEVNLPYISYTTQGELKYAYVIDEDLRNPFLESKYWADYEDDDDWDGDIVEGAVASTFWDLFDGIDSNDYPDWSTSEHGDFISNEYEKIWTIIQYDHPNDIFEFWDYWSARYGADMDLYWIFKHQRIDVDMPDTPVLSYDPTSINFWDVNQGDTDSTAFQIWNSGGQTLTYTIDENVNWLSIDPDEGSSSGETDNIYVYLQNTDTMSPGYHETTISIDSNGGTGLITVSVNIVENSEPILSYSPSIINFGDILQGNNDDLDFEIWNSGNDVLTYGISEEVAWLDIYPTSGTSSGETDTITVYLQNTHEMSPGSYQTTISIDSNGGTGEIDVYVNILENPEPELSYSPSHISFGGVSQGTTDTETFEIWNSDQETLTYSISENVGWLSVSPESGSSNGEHDTIYVYLNTNGLSPGSYQTTISIDSNAGNGAISVYVTVLESGEFINIDQPVYDRGFPIRHALDGDWAGAQSFNPTCDVFTKVEMPIRRFGSPEFDLEVELRKNHPEGTLIDSIIIPKENVPSSWEWVTFDFVDVTVSSSTEYFIVIPPAPSGVTTSFGYEWGYAFGNQYDDGAFWFTRDGGNLWRDLPSTYEFGFRVYGGSGGSTNDPPYSPTDPNPSNGQILIKPSSQEADVNGDGQVDGLDIYYISQHLGETGPPEWIDEDVDNDGEIDQTDIDLVSWIIDNSEGPTIHPGIYVYDPDGDSITVGFYWSDGTLIQEVSDVQSGTVATCSYSTTMNIPDNTYYWYAVADDENNNPVYSSTFSFTIQENGGGGDEILDQYCDGETSTQSIHVKDGEIAAQSFVPTTSTLTRVQMLLQRCNSPSNIQVSIRSSLDGSDLTSTTISTGDLSPDILEWFDIDLTDISTTPGNTYYIIIASSTTPDNSGVYWKRSSTSYPSGSVWGYGYSNDPDNWQDFEIDSCFKTYGYL